MHFPIYLLILQKYLKITVNIMVLELLACDGDNGHLLSFATSHPAATGKATGKEDKMVQGMQRETRRRWMQEETQSNYLRFVLFLSQQLCQSQRWSQGPWMSRGT